MSKHTVPHTDPPLRVLQVQVYMAEGKIITKSKVGSLTIQPVKYEFTSMPLYRMYPYPIRSSMLWLAIHTIVLLVNTISKIILESLKNFAKYQEILPKFLRNYF